MWIQVRRPHDDAVQITPIVRIYDLLIGMGAHRPLSSRGSARKANGRRQPSHGAIRGTPLIEPQERAAGQQGLEVGRTGVQLERKSQAAALEMVDLSAYTK